MIGLNEIDERSRDIFQRLVETYLATGEPVGSRTLSHEKSISVSAATVRNTMADLTEMGLLHAPHISAGRMPTELGLRLFVDGLLQVGDLTEKDRQAIESESSDRTVETLLEDAATRLSGLTQTASLVAAQNPIPRCDRSNSSLSAREKPWQFWCTKMAGLKTAPWKRHRTCPLRPSSRQVTISI